MAELLFPELSYKINGLCFQAHNEIGRFGREKQYADRVEELFIKNNIEHEREFLIERLEQSPARGNRVDFYVKNNILLDLKTKNFITKEDYYQMQRYLKAANLKLGLIVNFRTTYLHPKRILCSHS
ncbi:MAG: GxxExxY protein [Candidatus Jacksonbacteria bacterium]|jgi:GxxExxY protein|nr:GxxExxY protein [Candidatus Jacksonbacteria bacterium]MBT6034823.1 GxxExxY protein [Candidatus Jacksonbacteria bacterium]MBT6300933.1 GxxExxY protein [Candidatus Jacksonbacteria bacterium]MBT6757425.1 GxxExxY protein [Candidatus Jacksonbacteria bacterium]MBT6954915.1 GxxExxY protein [Candidatus Jacksonbacteria bacterium]